MLSQNSNSGLGYLCFPKIQTVWPGLFARIGDHLACTEYNSCELIRVVVLDLIGEISLVQHLLNNKRLENEDNPHASFNNFLSTCEDL